MRITAASSTAPASMTGTISFRSRSMRSRSALIMVMAAPRRPARDPRSRRLVEQAIDTATGHAELLGDGGRTHGGGQADNFGRVEVRRAAVVPSFRFSLGDAVALPL